MICMKLLPFKPDVISLSESRIHQPLKNLHIAGYNFVNVKPKGKSRGVAIYVKTTLKLTKINSFQLHGTEALWLKIWHQNPNKTYVIELFIGTQLKMSIN